jgi:predicted transcriptional regulator
MGRPKVYDEPRIATAIRLPRSLRDQLQEAARERDVSVNLLVTRAVLDFLNRLPALNLDEVHDERGAGRHAVKLTP